MGLGQRLGERVKTLSSSSPSKKREKGKEMKQDKLKDRQSQAQFIFTGYHALIKPQKAQTKKDEERTRMRTSKQNYI